ncbi:ADAMTS-like protein 2 [Acanthaster planci]|uniref:ADAMTS-like protein 2 n=1 Tax=Acanthaster planci TaxID=133434 RepID=A0A8B7XTY0_ACAPL|nr:ADAMTS-like protein 2 [Acanthaster planci]XP_022084313.1 ADAMTS-like protein 2 [Acanthaster planci]XP_022084314.1 ADAMTS-like protein 2 [Acanthaster planci]
MWTAVKHEQGMSPPAPARRGHGTTVPVQDHSFQTSWASERRMTGGKIYCTRSKVVSCRLSRLILQWLVLLSHMYSTQGLSELRHQLTDTSLNTTAETSSSHWSEYGLWSACNGNCSYAIQYRDRRCLNQRNDFLDSRFCVGSARQYRICRTELTQPCPNPMVLRSELCTAHRESNVTWQAYSHPSVGTCQVACYARKVKASTRAYTVLDQGLPDGTPCSKYRGCDWWNRVSQSQGICLQGQCLDVGCDGTINSTKALDSCGVCGGDGSSCRIVSGRFTETLQGVSTEVVEIPGGAFNVRVYEVEKSRNHLAITDETGRPVLNSFLGIWNPGRYEVAGATATYKRCGVSRFSPGHYEEILIHGATSVKIIISILSREKYTPVHVAYQYSLPLPRSHGSQTTASPTTSVTLEVTTEVAEVIELMTTLATEESYSSGTPFARQGHQNMHNVIAVKTLSYSDDETEADSGSQGTSDQLPSFSQGRSKTSFLEHSTSTEVTKPAAVDKTDMYMEIQNESSGYKQNVDTPDSEDTLENTLPENGNSTSLHERPSTLAKPADMFSETQGNDPWVENVGPEDKQGILPELETSGHLDESRGQTTLKQTSQYISSDSFVPENSTQIIPVTAEPPLSLDPEQPANSTVASSIPSSSPSSGQTDSLENDLFQNRDGNPYVTRHQDEGRGSRSFSEPTNIPATSTQRTITEKDLDDLPDFPLEHRPSMVESTELLFGEVPQIMELIKPSPESLGQAAHPSTASGATSIVISRGDVPEEERRVKPRYLWARTGVAPCSTTCTRGMSRSYAYCTLNGEQVPDNLCDPASKPEVVERECGGKPCEPRWAVGRWSQCTVSCGTGAVYRTVHCWLMIAPGLDTSISNAYCNQSNVPDSVGTCTQSPCGPQWQISDWSECSVACGEGTQTREVHCSAEDGSCNPTLKPSTTKRCFIPTCPSEWTTSRWSQCQGPCTIQHRRVDCVNSRGIIVGANTCPTDSKPLSHRLCGEGCPAQWVAQSYGPCLGDCGSTVRRRRVICAATSAVSGRMQVLANSVCSASQRPGTETSCQLVSCQSRPTRRRRQTPQWLTTPWSVCSVTCGNGRRTRQVTCNRKRNQSHLNCNKDKEPDSWEPCAMGDCPTVNPACSDSPKADCNLIRRANLCRYDSYRRSCCLSCSP